MKYKLSKRKYWRKWIKNDLSRWYYSTFYKFKMGGMGGTLVPTTGKGKFVSVYSKGKIIQIIDEENKHNEIRIIPCQSNHGVMVEQLVNGKLKCRNHLDIKQLNKDIIYASNVEQLTNKKRRKI